MLGDRLAKLERQAKVKSKVKAKPNGRSEGKPVPHSAPETPEQNDNVVDLSAAIAQHHAAVQESGVEEISSPEREEIVNAKERILTILTLGKKCGVLTEAEHIAFETEMGVANAARHLMRLASFGAGQVLSGPSHADAARVNTHDADEP